MNIFKIKPAALLALALIINFPVFASDLNIENAWIAEAPPVSKVLAAYMKIENLSKNQVTIVSAASDDFDRIEFHRTLHEGGMARMQQQQELVITAGEQLKLEPGGYHMMMFSPSRSLPAGTKSTLRLKLADGQIVEVVAEVKKATMDSSHEHHHH